MINPTPKLFNVCACFAVGYIWAFILKGSLDQSSNANGPNTDDLRAYMRFLMGAHASSEQAIR